MSYLFFEAVLEELGKKLNYQAVVNYAGNSFAKDSWNMIQDAYPMKTKPVENAGSPFAAFLAKA